MRLKKILIVFSLFLVAFFFVGCKKDSKKPYFVLIETNEKIANNKVINVPQGGKLENVIKTVNMSGTVTFSLFDETGNSAVLVDYNDILNPEHRVMVVARNENGDMVNVIITINLVDTQAPILTIKETEISLMQTLSYNLKANINSAIDPGRGHFTDDVQFDVTGLPGAKVVNGVLDTTDCAPGTGEVVYHYTDPGNNEVRVSLEVTVTELVDALLYDVLDTDGNVIDSISHTMVWNPVLYSQYTIQEIAWGTDNLQHVIGLTYDYVKWYSKNAPERLVAQWSIIYICDETGYLKYVRHYQTNELYVTDVQKEEVDADGNVVGAVDENGKPIMVPGVVSKDVDTITDWSTGDATSYNGAYKYTHTGRMLANIFEHMEEGDYCLVFVNDGTNADGSPRATGDTIFTSNDTTRGLMTSVKFTGTIPTFNAEEMGPVIYVPVTETGSITTTLTRGDETPDFLEGIYGFIGNKDNTLDLTGLGIMCDSNLAPVDFNLSAITNEEIFAQFAKDNREMFEEVCRYRGLDYVAGDETEYYELFANLKADIFARWLENQAVTYYYSITYTDETTGLSDRVYRIYKVCYPEVTLDLEIPGLTFVKVTIDEDPFKSEAPEFTYADFGVKVDNQYALKTNNDGQTYVNTTDYTSFFYVYSKEVLSTFYTDETYPVLTGLVVVLDAEGKVVGVRNSLEDTEGTDTVFDGTNWVTNSNGKTQTQVMDGLVDLVPENGYVAIFPADGGENKVLAYALAKFVGTTEEPADLTNVTVSFETYKASSQTPVKFTTQKVDICGTLYDVAVDQRFLLTQDETYTFVGASSLYSGYLQAITRDMYDELGIKDLGFYMSGSDVFAIICDENGKAIEWRQLWGHMILDGLLWCANDADGNPLWDHGTGNIFEGLDEAIPEGGFVLFGCAGGGWLNEIASVTGLAWAYSGKAISGIVNELPKTVDMFWGGKNFTATYDDPSMWAQDTVNWYGWVCRFGDQGDTLHVVSYEHSDYLDICNGVGGDGFGLVLDANNKFVAALLAPAWGETHTLVTVVDGAIVRSEVAPGENFYGLKDMIPVGGKFIYANRFSENENLAQKFTDLFNKMSDEEILEADFFTTDPFPTVKEIEITWAGTKYVATLDDPSMWQIDASGYGWTGRIPANNNTLHVVTYDNRQLLDVCSNQWGQDIIILDANNKLSSLILAATWGNETTDYTLIKVVDGQIVRTTINMGTNWFGAKDLIPEGGKLIYVGVWGDTVNLGTTFEPLLSALTDEKLLSIDFIESDPFSTSTGDDPVEEAPVIDGGNLVLTVGETSTTMGPGGMNTERHWGSSFAANTAGNADWYFGLSEQNKSLNPDLTCNGGIAVIVDKDGLIQYLAVNTEGVNKTFTRTETGMTEGTLADTNVLNGVNDLLPTGGMLIFANDLGTDSGYHLALNLFTALASLSVEELATATLSFVA